MIATLNLNGDYVSDALAANVGGIGIAPGANINYVSGKAIFEATHGTAPKYTGDKHPFHIPRNGSRFFDDLNLTNKTSIRTVNFNQMSFANPSSFDQIKPVRSGPVQ